MAPAESYCFSKQGVNQFAITRVGRSSRTSTSRMFEPNASRRLGGVEKLVHLN
jgi:hypothetical protein